MINIKSNKNLYLVVHTQEYGASTGLILSDKIPSTKRATKALGFDFDPDPCKCESVEIYQIIEGDVVEL